MPRQLFWLVFLAFTCFCELFFVICSFYIYSGISCERYSLSGSVIVGIVLGTVIPIMAIIITIAIIVYVCCVRKTKPKFMQNNNKNNGDYKLF